ncbi:MAG: cytochrome C [Burkholderiaceae bacterium]|nr:cytochrome C [Burkholderiaceae bacterium]
MSQKWVIAFMFAWLGACAVANAQTTNSASRGELLYSTHCIGCHSTQIHWRNKRVAKNWVSLKAEVDQWQKTSELGWSEEDVTDVARYLNTLHYRFPTPEAALQPGMAQN